MGPIKVTMTPGGAPTVGSTKRLATIRVRNNNMLILCTVIVIIASSILSVDAIKCHQCNSHLEPNCAALNIPKAVKADEYLKKCEGLYDGHIPFCRKTAVTIEHTEEQRIVRSCGWVNSKHNQSDRCLNADNEGYLERICVCFSDGCNSAPLGASTFNLFSMLLATILSLLMRFV